MLEFRQTPRRKFVAIWFVAAGCLALSWSMPTYGAAGPPTEVVRNFYNVLLDIMQHSAALGPKGRYQKLESVVRGTFDDQERTGWKEPDLFESCLTGTDWIGHNPRSSLRV